MQLSRGWRGYRCEMLDLDVVDAHHHLWENRDDLGGPASYLLDDLLADASELRLVQSVHLEAVPQDPLAEALWLQEMADEHGFPHAIVASARLQEPGAEAALEALSAISNVRGVRQILNRHIDPAAPYDPQHELMEERAWSRSFARLATLGMSFDLQVYPSQLARAARLASDHPSTLVILNHAGMPPQRDSETLAQWRSGLKLLAAQPNTAAKISGIGMTDNHWSVASMRPIVLGVIDAFGADRSMFASNFPVDKRWSTYSAIYESFDEITSDFTRDERAGLFAGNARRFYRMGG